MNTPYPKPRMPYNNNTKLSSNSLFAKKKKKMHMQIPTFSCIIVP